ncbi:MAG: LytR family transcriptional regulator [Chloroflexota bacterium]|nr:MAG: LytR family transcriptional regulator [Chloroflexota bacterium]
MIAYKRAIWLAAVCLTLFLCTAGARQARLQSDDGGETPPPPAPPLPLNGANVTPFLLLGTDSGSAAGRTDVIIVVFVHHDTDTVSLLSIPRDLYVYIPGWQMQRINTAYPHGRSANPDGGGIELLRETLRYNLGLDVEKYARVDFATFKQLIDMLGGVELTVDCAIEDWRLLEPGLDPAEAANWALFTLPAGVHNMDGELALWYVRSRRTSSDFDRGRRQHDMLRAIWRRADALKLLEQLPELWQRLTTGMVETNITLPDAMALLSTALHFDPNRLDSYTFRLNREVTQWRSPEGASVLLPVPEAIARIEEQALTPLTANQVASGLTRVEIINATGRSGMHRVAADRLAWEGVQASVSSEQIPAQANTTIIDYTGQSKGSYLETLRQVLRVAETDVIQQPSASREFDFRVILGSSYYACTYGVIPPQPAGS